jgi:hypothetical protein
MTDKKYNNVGVWDIRLYKYNSDGLPEKDSKGEVILYEAPQWLGESVNELDMSEIKEEDLA